MPHFMKEISPEELKILNDSAFFMTKKKVTEKIYALFSETNQLFKEELTHSNITIPKGVDIIEGKIFRGENYRDLPYLVMDFPKLFNKESVFTFRNMLWWGNFFSCTLHLEGEALNEFRKKLIQNKDVICNDNFWFCVNEKSPWEYHYQKENYLPAKELGNELTKMLEEKTFIKISKFISLEEWQRFPSFAKETLTSCFIALR